METPDTQVQAARRFALLAIGIVLAVSCLFDAPARHPWCGPVSVLGPFGERAPDHQQAMGLVLVLLLIRGRIDYLTASAFTLAGAIWAEGQSRIHHVFHLPALLFWVEATPALRTERMRGATIGVWHAHAALSKLSAHGLGWADGHSMAIWLESFAWPWMRWTAGLPTWLLAAGQWCALFIEAAAPLAAWPQARPYVGAALLLFYAAVLATFPFGFAGNAALVFLYLTPKGTTWTGKS